MMSTTTLGHLEDLVEYLKREATVEQRTQFRKAITDELGLPDATQDDILKSIRELRSSNTEAATQLQELRKAFSEQRALGRKDNWDAFRAACTHALELDVRDDDDILKAIRELRANGAEDDRQLAVSRADCSRMYEQRAAARAECLERTEERDVARAECLRLRSVRAELERLVGSL